MENGTVKFFDSRNNKRYGFIVVDGGGEIFFHYNDGGNFGVTYNLGDPMVSFVGGKLGTEPKKGDRVVFDIVPGSKGRSKAFPWGFMAAYNRMYEKAVREKTKAPVRTKTGDTIYQVLWHELDENLIIKHTVPLLFWEGTFAELCRKFPQARDPNKDPLFIASKGYIVGFRYNAPTPNGWEMCNDPRPLVKE